MVTVCAGNNLHRLLFPLDINSLETVPYRDYSWKISYTYLWSSWGPQTLPSCLSAYNDPTFLFSCIKQYCLQVILDKKHTEQQGCSGFLIRVQSTQSQFHCLSQCPCVCLPSLTVPAVSIPGSHAWTRHLKVEPIKWGKLFWMTSIKTIMDVYHLQYKNKMEYISWHREEKAHWKSANCIVGKGFFLPTSTGSRYFSLFQLLLFPIFLKKQNKDMMISVFQTTWIQNFSTVLKFSSCCYIYSLSADASLFQALPKHLI